MLTYLGAFVAMFVYVHTKSAQQFNVLRFRYWLVWPYSLAMQLCFVFVVSQIAITQDLWLVIPLSAGAALGSNAAMYMNQRWMGEGDE